MGSDRPTASRAPWGALPDEEGFYWGMLALRRRRPGPPDSCPHVAWHPAGVVRVNPALATRCGVTLGLVRWTSTTGRSLCGRGTAVRNTHTQFFSSTAGSSSDETSTDASAHACRRPVEALPGVFDECSLFPRGRVA